MKNLKIKFNLKLTVSLVSFFVGFIFILFARSKPICLSIGLWFFALSLILFALYNADRCAKKVREINSILENNFNELDELDKVNTEELEDKDNEELKEYRASLEKESAGLIKQLKVFEKGTKSTKYLLIVVGAILTLLGFLVLFS